MKSIRDIIYKVDFIKLKTPASILLLLISNLYLFNKVNYLQKEFYKHTRSKNHLNKNNIKEILESCETESHSHYVDVVGEIYQSQPAIDCD